MKETGLLQAQIDKLNNKDFDLDAWKQYTVVLLSRIFGEHDPKIRQIEKIEYDFSSWSLRDTSGKSAYMETCKKLGREVLQASIDELKAFGLPDTHPAEKYIPAEVVKAALEDELKIAEFRKLKNLLLSEEDRETKIRSIKKLTDTFGKDFYENVLIGMLSNPQLVKVFQE